MHNVDIAIVGGGAAGLATAIFARRLSAHRSVCVLDGAARLGAKILVSGGGRCNVTNRVVTPADFCGGSRHVIKRVLDAFPVERTVAFFRDIGVALHEEEHGKLFPDSNRARNVLDALVTEAARQDVHVLTNHRVVEMHRDDRGIQLVTPTATLSAEKVVLATGGKSLPKTGSDGFGHQLAQKLGHSIVRLTPALVPLILDGQFHTPLSGISLPVELTVRSAGEKPARVTGDLLWTHFGISGPAVLDASRHWLRARLDRRDVSVQANFIPHHTEQSLQQDFLAVAASQPRMQLQKALAAHFPARMANLVLSELHIEPTTLLAYFPRENRRKLAVALTQWPLPVRDSRGYNFAEVTAGGVPLTEVDSRTLASRTCPGLFLVGEILDVDGRIGGFNFQWSWSTAHTVAVALARP